MTNRALWTEVWKLAGSVIDLLGLVLALIFFCKFIYWDESNRQLADHYAILSILFFVVSSRRN